MIADELKRAFRWHMQEARDREQKIQRGQIAEFSVKVQRDRDSLMRGKAARALHEARADVAQGKARYPVGFVPFGARGGYREEGDGLRYVGRVSAEFRRGPFGGRESEGWLTLPGGETYRDGSGLCFGVVYRLPGRRGESRYVAGYEFGGCDGGPTLDLKRIFANERGASYWDGSAPDTKASRAAARHADSLAKAAAEEEREYQTAWTAGQLWQESQSEVTETRAELRALLAERRAVKGAGAYPALCAAIRSQVAQLWHQIHKAREAMRELAEGDSENLIFWPGDARLREAFNDGAGQEVLK